MIDFVLEMPWWLWSLILLSIACWARIIWIAYVTDHPWVKRPKPQVGEFYAYENNCIHQGGPACQGKIINRVEEVIHETEKTAHGLKFSENDVHIVCPWHGYEYNVRTGRHPGHKNIRLKPFKVDVKDGEVYVVV